MPLLPLLAWAWWQTVPSLPLALLGLLGLLLLGIRRPWLPLLWVAPLAPLYIYPRVVLGAGVQPHEVLLGAALLGTLFRELRAEEGWGERLRPLRHPLGVGGGGLLFLGALALAAAPLLRPAEALREARLLLAEPALYALLLARWRRRLLPEGLWIWLGAGAAYAALGVLQWLLYPLGVRDLLPLLGIPRPDFVPPIVPAEGVVRALSLFTHPNNFGLWLERVFPLAAALALAARGPRRRWGIAVALLTGAGLFVSFSRGSWLGTAAALWGIVLLVGDRRWLLGWALASLAAAVALPLTNLERFTSLFTLTRSSATRLNLWRSSLAMLRDHLWTGVGPDQFLYYYREVYIRPEAAAEPNLSHPHNLILDAWLRLGPLAVPYFLGLLVLGLRKAWRALGRDRALALGLLGAWTALVVHGMVDNFYFTVELAYAFWWLLALSLALVEGEEKGKVPSSTEA